MKILFAAAIVLAMAALFASCGEPLSAGDVSTGEDVPETTTSPIETGLTEEFQQFLELRKSRPQTARTEEAEGVIYSLDGGVLRVQDANGTQLWQSEEGWYAEDFRLGDVTGDGSTDLLFCLWKSYSFGASHPARLENDDAAVRCHLFLYTLRAGRMKPLWCSSSLPRPVYSFELSFDGEQTPVASGAVLRTTEGQYQDDFSITEAKEYHYFWQGWGFVPE